jgi:hypothetical protein
MSYSGESVLPALLTVQPTKGDAYLVVARELLPAVEALSVLPSIPPRAAATIAAHTLECVLKAYLWHKNNGRTDIQKHDILKLWVTAHREGLSIEEAPPTWVQILGTGHGPNFYFRYQEGEEIVTGDGRKSHVIVNGGSTPALIPMAVELKKLIQTVESSVRLPA